MGKAYCQACNKKCSGEVLRVTDKYFHMSCFVCRTCNTSLAHGGFFCKDGVYYCPQDYQKSFGTRCATCNSYVEGEVVSALGNTYHQKCFTCARCRQAFPSGEKVTYTGKEVLCQKCVNVPVKEVARNQTASPTTSNPNECAGCNQELSEGQALVALDRQWHMWCFSCRACGCVLHGEYMGRDGIPYCEKDYQRLYGVRCAYCSRFISGKVLQAGDNHHFHPTCARCTKCGDPFGDGEEMFLQGGAIWHPRCGPGPGLESIPPTNGHATDSEVDRASSVAASDMQFSMRSRTPSLNGSLYSPYNSINRKQFGSYWSRVGSPGLILREYGGRSGSATDGASSAPHRILTYSYLTEQPTQGYLRRPIEPYDRPPTSPHFHRPHSSNSSRGGTLYSRSSSKSSQRPGMRVLVDSIRSETPRPKSPAMNNEEPIELAHYPAASKPPPGYKPKIERDDFPAPPYPYTDPERRRRWSDTYKGVPVSDEEENGESNGKVNGKSEVRDPQLKKEEQELSKIETGMAKVFLKNVKDREKVKQWKKANLDPRNASRTPSASKEPTYRLRYESPVGASPSRNVDHPRLFDEEEYSLTMDRSSSYRGSVGRSVGQIPSYNVMHVTSRPGYSLKSSTLPATIHTNGCNGDFSFSGLGDKTHSTEFSSGKSDISGGSITDVDRSAMTAAELPVSSTFVGVLRAGASSTSAPYRAPGGVRRSLPNMAHSHLVHEPAKIYPYHLLLITNYRLPHDVDRLNLERHLSDMEFEAILQCGRHDFYRLPQWRRNDIKRRARLF
ncbi:actin binding LIM protein Uncoordinated 115a isoform X2 [Arctopsyche grandis]|uniref:actin binding LIM protein Uncoordinated 115a isoform X2 n=1 Tax=Arctopsyche grandis TaxID=121162 RepID=UPI00406D9B63